MRRSFSLIELLVCIGIILVVIAITFPIVTTSKLAALKVKSNSNLHQLYMALAIYREGYDGVDVGDLYRLGLPPLDYYNDVIAKDLRPPLAGRYPGLGWYYMMPPDPLVVEPSIAQAWKDYNSDCAASSILLVDANFSDHPPLGGSPFLDRVGYGVRLHGGLAHFRKPGSPLSYNWWGCGP